MKTTLFRFTTLIFCLLLALPSFAKDNPTATKSVAGNTPDATFDGMKGAVVKKDWASFVSGMSPDSQDMMIGIFSLMTIPGFPGSENTKGLPDLLAKHGAKPLTLNDIVAAQGDPKKTMEIASQRGALVKDKIACIGDVMGLMEKGLGKGQIASSFAEIGESTLSDVKIDGDKATAKIKSKKEGAKDEEVVFKKIDNKWYMDVPGMTKGK